MSLLALLSLLGLWSAAAAPHFQKHRGLDLSAPRLTDDAPFMPLFGGGICHNLFHEKYRGIVKEGYSQGDLVDAIVFARGVSSPILGMPAQGEYVSPAELDAMAKAFEQGEGPGAPAEAQTLYGRMSDEALTAKAVLDHLLETWATPALTQADPSQCGGPEVVTNEIGNYSDYVPTAARALTVLKSYDHDHQYPSVDNRDWVLEHLGPAKWFETWKVVHGFPAYCGADCVVGALIKPLLSAIHRERPFVSHGSRFASKDVCGDLVDKLTCFFEPFDACPFNLDADRTDLSNKDQWQQDNLNDILYAREYGYDNRKQVTPPALQPMGWFWLTSQLFRHLMSRPVHRLREQVEQTATELGIFDPQNRPLLALHVRLGDACTDSRGVDGTGRYCYGLADYMPQVQQMIDAYGIKAVYIATDSQQVIKNASLQYPQITWLSAPFNRSMFDDIFKKGSKYTMIEQLLFENRTAAYELGVSPAEVFDEAMLDTYLASYADAFVGNFASNMDRTAFALMAAQRTGSMACLPPFLSVGAPWCFDYGNDKGGMFTRKVYNASFANGVKVEATPFWC